MQFEWRKTVENYAGFFSFLVALMIIAVAFHRAGDNGSFKKLLLLRQSQQKTKYDETARWSRNCSLFSGRWIFDNVSYPLYEERKCSFMMDYYACLKFGREDVQYQNWRWQPHHCDLPRFDGKTLLEKIRGKRLVFVGDSLNRNQWVSMLCLIESALSPSSPKSVIKKGNFFIFRAIQYNATIEFYWSPYLVESDCDNPFDHSNLHNRTVRITNIEKHATRWHDADFLVFDSYAWWIDDPNITLSWGSVGSSDKRVYADSKLRRYEMSLNVWSDWLRININRTRTKLFFMSPSPFHVSRGGNGDVVPICHSEVEPILEIEEPKTGLDRDMMHIVESVMQQTKARGLNIEYLNISHMSDYRLDGHPSIYRKFPHTLSKERLENPKNFADCLHWCLPGLPDIWNQILYSYIVTPS